MAEFCLECWNKIMESNDLASKYLISKELELCEECGEWKPVIIRMKWRFVAREWLREQIEYFKKF